jgi:hypothetical protein
LVQRWCAQIPVNGSGIKKAMRREIASACRPCHFYHHFLQQNLLTRRTLVAAPVLCRRGLIAYRRPKINRGNSTN